MCYKTNKKRQEKQKIEPQRGYRSKNNYKKGEKIGRYEKKL